MRPDPDAHERIRGILDDIEARDQVRILFAVEAGSRAWGTASADSDYDVRFVYVRPAEWYWSPRKGRNVIERPIRDAMDVNGWDLQKALLLLLKANPVLLEWLCSPVVYRPGPAMEAMEDLAQRIGHRAVARHHYLHLGLNMFRQFIDGRDRVEFKRYFYCIRPAVALCWQRTHRRGRVPMDLPTLIGQAALDWPVCRAIKDLLAQMAVSAAGETVARVPILDQFIRDEFAYARGAGSKTPAYTPQRIAEAQGLFLRLLLQAFPMVPAPET